MNADGRVWGLWHRISKSEKLAVALWLSRAPFKHGDEKGWGRYRWRQPDLVLPDCAADDLPSQKVPCRPLATHLLHAQPQDAPESSCTCLPLPQHPALWLIPDRMSFVSKELNAPHSSVLAVRDSEALPLWSLLALACTLPRRDLEKNGCAELTDTGCII